MKKFFIGILVSAATVMTIGFSFVAGYGVYSMEQDWDKIEEMFSNNADALSDYLDRKLDDAGKFIDEKVLVVFTD